MYRGSDRTVSDDSFLSKKPPITPMVRYASDADCPASWGMIVDASAFAEGLIEKAELLTYVNCEKSFTPRF